MNATFVQNNMALKTIQAKAGPSPSTVELTSLFGNYMRVRTRTEALVMTLSAEDMVVQSMPDASPIKWHLAHTTWFFETFLLAEHLPNYKVFNPDYGYLFNSYYETLGPRQPRAQRGLLSRPPIEDIMRYRHYVDEHIETLMQSVVLNGVENLIFLGLAHEEQHQELMLMDILHLFAQSPLKPAYDVKWPTVAKSSTDGFQCFEGGLVKIGDDGSAFTFDNELPRHSVWVHPFSIGKRLVTNGEWLAFMVDGGYTRPEFWLSDGWTKICTEGWKAPMYWELGNDEKQEWQQMTLRGLEPIDVDAPVTHISYYEADAFAHWADARLPTEVEWETATQAGELEQVDNVVWQWTQSAYSPYSGYRTAPSAVGEYNGKFMSGQMVLRGGASVTPDGHTRPTYRNFFRPEQRWMFSGLRLARDITMEESLLSFPNANEFTSSEFAIDVIAGLSADKKSLSPKYFYDEAGSDLFEEICLLDEYYPTRTETALLSQIAAEIACDIPVDAVLVEFGSGASDKTRLILDAAPHISAYIPIDISVDALNKATASMKKDYPKLLVEPLTHDFTNAIELPAVAHRQRKIGFFPGSTIGNFTKTEAIQFLCSVRQLLGDEALLIIGADMVKDEATLLAAYNDAADVTAHFNKNLLIRINRELDGDFDLESFDHQAEWNSEHARIEMYLISRSDQIVQAAGQSFAFKAGERLHTENSHKFTSESFMDLAAQAGWAVKREWVSAAPQFAVYSLAVSL